MSKKLDKIFYTARLYKKSLSIIVDALLMLFSLFLAYWIRLGSIEALSLRYVEQIILLELIIVPFKIFLFWIFRLYHISYRYISLAEGLSVIKASAISSLTMALLVLILVSLVLYSFPIFSLRLFLRFLSEHFFVSIILGPTKKSEGIYLL